MPKLKVNWSVSRNDKFCLLSIFALILKLLVQIASQCSLYLLSTFDVEIYCQKHFKRPQRWLKQRTKFVPRLTLQLQTEKRYFCCCSILSLGLIFIFFFWGSMVMYGNEFETKENKN